MATYAAYRHVELDKVGCGKRRVLKPPGGGTSGLFATTAEEEQKPRLPQAEVSSPQNSSANLVNGIDVVNGKTDGNPVTGEGYDTQDNRHNGAAAPPTRTRIPPGGYSSGLW